MRQVGYYQEFVKRCTVNKILKKTRDSFDVHDVSVDDCIKRYIVLIEARMKIELPMF